MCRARQQPPFSLLYSPHLSPSPTPSFCTLYDNRLPHEYSPIIPSNPSLPLLVPPLPLLPSLVCCASSSPSSPQQQRHLPASLKEEEKERENHKKERREIEDVESDQVCLVQHASRLMLGSIHSSLLFSSLLAYTLFLPLLFISPPELL